MTFGYSWLKMAPCERQKPFHFLTNTSVGEQILIFLLGVKTRLEDLSFKSIFNEKMFANSQPLDQKTSDFFLTSRKCPEIPGNRTKSNSDF